MNIQNIKIFLLFCTCLLMFGCANSFQNLQSSYQDGRYLDAARYAVDGLKNKELKPQVVDFLTKNGDDLVKKAFMRGESLLNNVSTESPIQYFTALSQILDELILQDMPIKDLPNHLAKAKQNTQLAIDRFVEYKYNTGMDAYKRKLYRKADANFGEVQKYMLGYKNTAEYAGKTQQKARRAISVAPLYKPVNSVTQFLSDTLVNVITGGRSKNAGIMTEKLVIDGVDVPDMLNARLISELNRHKSKYIQVSMDDSKANIDNTQYYVEGIMDASETFNRYLTTDDNNVSHLNIEYTVNVTVKASVFLTKNNQEVKTISFQTSAKNIYKFNNSVEGYFSKNEVIQEAISRAGQRLSAEILEITDQDMDPYQIYIAADEKN